MEVFLDGVKRQDLSKTQPARALTHSALSLNNRFRIVAWHQVNLISFTYLDLIVDLI